MAGEPVKLQGWQMVERDLTEVQAAANWGRELTALEAMLGAARMPVILTDPRQADDPIVFANRAFLELTGYRREDVLGRNCRLLQGPGTDPEAVETIHNALRKREPVSVNILNYRAGGSPFWNALFIGPVFDADGELRYFMGNQLDITSAREADEALHQLRKVEALGQLTAGLGHNLNNLLQVISGGLELLSGKQQDPVLWRHGERALQAARQAARLNQQLLAFARKAPLAPRPLDLAATVAALQPLAEAAAGGHARLKLDLAPTPRVLLDRTQLEAALLGLVANASDALDAGGEIVVRTAACDIDGAPAALLEVFDTGCGMSADVRHRAVEPFFTTKSGERHAGLGLSMVSGFVTQSGGRLQIESERPGGTRVQMLIPATFSRLGPVEAADDIPEQGAPASRALIVDDNPDVLQTVGDMLWDLGCEVALAASAEAALSLLPTTPPFDIAIVDVLMPGGMNGLECAEQIARQAPQTHVVLATAYAPSLGEEPSSWPVLLKPMRKSALAQQLGIAMRSSRPSS